MRLLLVFARAYPRRTLLTMLCLVLAALADGLGVSSILPLMRLAVPGAAAPVMGSRGNTALEERVLALFHAIGLEPTMRALFALTLTGMLLKALLLLVANRQVGYTVAHTATTLRLDLIRALLTTRWEYYVHQPISHVANAFAREAQLAAEAYLRATTILAFVVQAVVYTVVACLVSWQAAAVALAGGAAIVMVLSRLVRLARRAGARQTKLMRTLLARLTDTLHSVKALKAMAREPLIAPVLEGETQRLNRALQREVISTAAMDSLQEPLIFLFLATSLYVAVALLAMPLAGVVMLVFLCARLLGAVSRVQKDFQYMAVRSSAFWALRDLTRRAQAAVEVLPGGRSPSLQREIRLASVGFAYEQDLILRDASLVIPAGTLTVITGPSGGGKTTVADLIIGLLQPSAGGVFVDGVPLREIDARRWREMIGYVPQETLMLHDSVAMNVTLGDPSVSRDDVIAALEAAGAWEFVSALPTGLDTVVGERGLRLSGGQRQRLALARAVVRQPALLVLDEATTALDPATERSICETLRQLTGSMTLIAICHHGHLVEIADNVYRVGNGRITLVRSGTGADKRSVAGG
jgi:ATP-binding cassette, subfamily C, bacterial